jgi:CheY-like chemotaxis protein
MATILLADNSDKHIALVDMLLSLDGHVLHVARDGREALAYLKEHTPDLIIAELELPLLDGGELCARVRKVNRLRGVPFVLFTAVRDPGRLELARREGVNLVVPKPLEGKDFRRIVSGLIHAPATVAA